MNKAKALIIIIAMAIMGNLFLLVGVPFLAGITTTVNATLAASSNMTNYPGTSNFLLSTPWILYVLFNVVCLIIVVLVLKAKPSTSGA